MAIFDHDATGEEIDIGQNDEENGWTSFEVADRAANPDFSSATNWYPVGKLVNDIEKVLGAAYTAVLAGAPQYAVQEILDSVASSDHTVQLSHFNNIAKDLVFPNSLGTTYNTVSGEDTTVKAATTPTYNSISLTDPSNYAVGDIILLPVTSGKTHFVQLAKLLTKATDAYTHTPISPNVLAAGDAVKKFQGKASATNDATLGAVKELTFDGIPSIYKVRFRSHSRVGKVSSIFGFYNAQFKIGTPPIRPATGVATLSLMFKPIAEKVTISSVRRNSYGQFIYFGPES